MSKSLRNERSFSNDYEYEDVSMTRQSKKDWKRMQRRQDKRSARELPCEREN